jgi:hypothetical protein
MKFNGYAECKLISVVKHLSDGKSQQYSPTAASGNVKQKW